MNLSVSLEEALAKASPILREKMLASIALLKKAEKLSLMYDAEDGFYLAFSGGKDSQALYHIAQIAGVKFKAHFSPTTVDPPQVIKFVRKNYPDVEFGKVKKNIYDMAVEKMILPTMRVRWCCAEYKEMAGAGKVTLIGIRHAESARRAKRKEVEISNRKFSGNFEQFTEWQEEAVKKKYKNINQDQFTHDKQQEIRCINGKDSILVSPIIEWTEKDVWEFLNDVCEVPHCELYDKGYHRIGCILCPMSNPKQKLRECEDFPYVKAKWIDAIKRIRQGGGVSQDKPISRGGQFQTIQDPQPEICRHPSGAESLATPARDSLSRDNGSKWESNGRKRGAFYIKEEWGGGRQLLQAPAKYWTGGATLSEVQQLVKASGE